MQKLLELLVKTLVSNEDGVSVTVDDDYYAVKPENVLDFFNDVVVKKVK